MKILLSGATGFLGSEVLRQALERRDVELVTAVTRRPIGTSHPKLREVVLDDFLKYSAVDLAGHDACIWCLGVSQAAVDATEYVRITQDYALAAAKALFKANPKARFCFVSGRSADLDEKSDALFAKVKGRTERKLLELGGQVVRFRPGYIQPTARSVRRRDAGRFFLPIAMLINLFTDHFSVDCDVLAQSLLDVARDGVEVTLLRNAELRSWPKPLVGASK